MASSPLDVILPQLEGTINAIFDLLRDNGVPESRIDTLKANISKENYIETFHSAQQYTRVYPYMDTPRLIHLLGEAWEFLCQKNAVIHNQAHKKVLLIKVDPKSDPDTLKAAENVRDELAAVCTESNIGLYRMRALRSLYQQTAVNDN